MTFFIAPALGLAAAIVSTIVIGAGDVGGSADVPLAVATAPADSSPAAVEAVSPAPSSRSSAGAPRRATGTRIVVRKSRYGRVLFDGRQRALYLFTREPSSASRCYGGCATAWPPLLTHGRPAAGAGTRAGLIGTTPRRDGTTQVTYAGHPLYRYVGDREPLQILCQNVVEFGGTWLVVAPDGRPVH